MLVLHKLELPLESGVEVVLDVVVRAAGEQLGDLRPAIAHLLVSLNDHQVFILSPLVLFDIRI